MWIPRTRTYKQRTASTVHWTTRRAHLGERSQRRWRLMDPTPYHTHTHHTSRALPDTQATEHLASSCWRPTRSLAWRLCTRSRPHAHSLTTQRRPNTDIVDLLTVFIIHQTMLLPQSLVILALLASASAGATHRAPRNRRATHRRLSVRAVSAGQVCRTRKDDQGKHAFQKLTGEGSYAECSADEALAYVRSHKNQTVITPSSAIQSSTAIASSTVESVSNTIAKSTATV